MTFSVSMPRSVEELVPVTDDSRVAHVDYPYYYLYPRTSGTDPRLVIFFGKDMYHFPPSWNREIFIRKTNECLDYIRRTCAGYDLCYRPHPAETDEHKFLNLEGFRIMEDGTVGEMFLAKNLGNIKYVFSTISGVSASAHALGLNSYLFFEPLHEAFDTETRAAFRDYFTGLPEAVFIRDFEQLLQENKMSLRPDPALEQGLRDALTKKSGTVWFISNDPKLAVVKIALARLIRSLDPSRTINFVLIRHRRWAAIDLNDMEPSFDRIFIFPRIFFSIRPVRLIKSFMAAFRVRRMPIKNDDIIVSSAFDFIENCFLSYFPETAKLKFVESIIYNYNYSPKTLGTFKNEDFSPTRGSRFYNGFFEPLLGLHRTVFMYYKEGNILNVNRYVRPINEIYDRIFVLKTDNRTTS